MSAIMYLIWSQKRREWWAAGARGYTDNINHAGRFTEAEAIPHIISSANCGVREHVSFMVAAPDNWQPPTVYAEPDDMHPPAVMLVDVLTDYFTEHGVRP